MNRSNDSTRSVHESATTVVRGLDRQYEILMDLQKLAGSQGALIEAGEHDSLLRLVQRRQDLVQALEQARADMTEEISHVRQDMSSLDDQLRDRIGDGVSKVQELVNSIAATDMEDARRLSECQSERRLRLGNIVAATTARNSYQPTSAASSRFADAKG